MVSLLTSCYLVFGEQSGQPVLEIQTLFNSSHSTTHQNSGLDSEDAGLRETEDAGLRATEDAGLRATEDLGFRTSDDLGFATEDSSFLLEEPELEEDEFEVDQVGSDIFQLSIILYCSLLKNGFSMPRMNFVVCRVKKSFQANFVRPWHL